MIALSIYSNGMVNIVLVLLLFLPFLLVAIDTFFRILFLIISWMPITRNPTPLMDHTADLGVLYLFVANNEQKVIGESIKRVQQVAGLAPIDSIAVIADHCIDQTVDIAKQAGVKVYQRTDGNPGKSEALSWFASEIVKQIEADIIVVLDADTLVGEKFSEKIKSAFEKKVDVVQVFVHPIPSSKSSLSLLAAYSELLSQKIDDEARLWLGWPVPLRGTGMSFRKELFYKVCCGINTQVDDIELSLLLMEMGVTVHYCPQAEILDPKTNNILGLARQRGRWLKGQRYIWNAQRLNFVKLSKLILPSWSLVQSLMLKPKTALVFVKIILVGVLMSMSYKGVGYQIVLFLNGVCILVDFLYYLTGLRYVSNHLKILLAMVSAPLFLILWIISWGFSIFPGQGWLRARDE